MMNNKTTKKSKKPIETTLGKSVIKSPEKEMDNSHLRKPIETNITGIKQVLNAFQDATNEVKNILLYECDIMFECRTCRTIFRSLANFILHKRNYCKEKISPVDYINNNDIFKVAPVSSEPSPPSDNSPLARVIKKLHENEKARETAKQFLTADLTSEPGNQMVKSMDDREEKASNFNYMILEKIDSNDSGIFQTFVKDLSNEVNENELTKTEIMEIHKKLVNDVPILDPDGKICGFTSSKPEQASLFPNSRFKCTECNSRFSTQKSFINHMKYVHNPSRVVYICPTCKDTFVNPWCIYRHLLKVHRMTNKQVRRIRDQVFSSKVRRDEEGSIVKKKGSEVISNKNDSENQWINDIEGDKDFQMCAGCGKHFGRKAALHSHSQLCAKRLEVTNNILKENAKKRNEEEDGEKTKSDNKLKGASKRKSRTICSYRRKEGGQVGNENCPDLSGSDKKAELKAISEDLFPEIDSSNKGETFDESTKLSHNSSESSCPSSKRLKVSRTRSSSCEVISDSNSEAICVSDSDSKEAANCDSRTPINGGLDTSNLLSNKVSFNAFCKKIQASEGKKHNERILRKRKRKLSTLQELHESDSGKISIVYSDHDDDVIFINETRLVDENGFAGFANEETTQSQFSMMDLANLSYNNPLKSKIKGDHHLSEEVLNESNFLPRADPYMNRSTLTCNPCRVSFDNVSKLLWHMSAHFSWFRYQCGKCSFVTFNKVDCLTHARVEHKLNENSALSFILPLPIWKSVLMSHEFRLLVDGKDLKGRHTDENIGDEECSLQNVADSEGIFEVDSIFGDCSNNSEGLKCCVEENHDKKRATSCQIDIQQAGHEDSQKLPEPVELGMPVDGLVKTVVSFENDSLADETENLDHFPEESNDDWGLSKVCDQENGKIDPSLNTRPPRLRTKVKQNEDFVYYGTDFTNMLKTAELLKTSPPKQRPESKVSIKPVPSLQKRKS